MSSGISKLMTAEEKATKADIIDLLGEQGYPTYAKLFSKFALHLTADESVIGYMIPNKGIIVINRFLLLNQVSTIIRHEILHQYLDHGNREVAKLGEVRNMSLHELSNIAADYEISNRGYTDNDKRISRRIRLNGQILQGLVTEDEHPDWVDMTYEEMLDELMKEESKDQSKMKQTIQIGSQGDQAKQQAEAAQRAAQIAKENAESEEEAEAAEKAQELADEVIDELEDASGIGSEESDDNSSKGGKTSPDKGVFSDYELTPQDLREIEEAIAEIKTLLGDSGTASRIDRENANAIQKDLDVRKAREAERYKRNPLNQFLASLNGFIEKQVDYGRDKTWKKLNPTYSGRGIIRQGRSSSAMSKVPLVQVYYDRSGSWDTKEKQEIGKRGIDTLNKYVSEGLLKVEKYYFNTELHTEDPGGGGTAGQPILDHIATTKPDNVIIITDADIHDCTTTLQVPGAVWFLFVNGVSDNLKSHLSGRRLTRSFEISV